MTHSMDEMLAVFQKRMIADLKRGYPDYVMDDPREMAEFFGFTEEEVRAF